MATKCQRIVYHHEPYDIGPGTHARCKRNGMFSTSTVPENLTVWVCRQHKAEREERTAIGMHTPNSFFTKPS